MFRTLVYSLIFIGLAASCQSGTQSENSRKAEPPAPSLAQTDEVQMADPAGTPETKPEPVEPYSPTAPKPPAPVVARQIIRNATLRFRVENQTESGRRITGVVRQFGGIITNEEQTRDNGNLQTSLTVRVPAARLDTFLAVLLRESIFTDTKHITAEDVTKQFVDTEARIRSQKATEAKYLDLLKRARNVAEVIEVENQLRQMREEIEMHEAELRELKNDVAMSTVELSYYEAAETANAPESSWLSRLGHNIGDGFGLIGNFFLGLAYLLPLLLVVGVPVWLLVRWLRSRRPQP